MPSAAVPVTLTASERKILKKRVRGAKTPYRDRLRAQVALAAARGRANARIAADLRVAAATVRKWRGAGRRAVALSSPGGGTSQEGSRAARCRAKQRITDSRCRLVTGPADVEHAHSTASLTVRRAWPARSIWPAKSSSSRPWHPSRCPSARRIAR